MPGKKNPRFEIQIVQSMGAFNLFHWAFFSSHRQRVQVLIWMFHYMAFQRDPSYCSVEGPSYQHCYSTSGGPRKFRTRKLNQNCAFSGAQHQNSIGIYPYCQLIEASHLYMFGTDSSNLNKLYLSLYWKMLENNRSLIIVRYGSPMYKKENIVKQQPSLLFSKKPSICNKIWQTGLYFFIIKELSHPDELHQRIKDREQMDDLQSDLSITAAGFPQNSYKNIYPPQFTCDQ